MSLMKQCEYCPDFHDSCQSVKRVKGGVLIRMDLKCPVMETMLQITAGSIREQTHRLRKGGVYNEYDHLSKRTL